MDCFKYLEASAVVICTWNRLPTQGSVSSAKLNAKLKFSLFLHNLTDCSSAYQNDKELQAEWWFFFQAMHKKTNFECNLSYIDFSTHCAVFQKFYMTVKCSSFPKKMALISKSEFENWHINLPNIGMFPNYVSFCLF